MLVTRPGTQGAPQTSRDSLNLSSVLSDFDVVLCGQLTKKWSVSTGPQSSPSLGHITRDLHTSFLALLAQLSLKLFTTDPSCPQKIKKKKKIGDWRTRKSYSINSRLPRCKDLLLSSFLLKNVKSSNMQGAAQVPL